MMRKNNQGYTLVELLVGITVGALVTLAATTVILMGLRLNRQSMDTAGKQNTARVLLTAMENLATDGSISGFSADDKGWIVFGKTEKETAPGESGTNAAKEYDAIYSYVADQNAIYTGSGELFMKNVEASELKHKNGLLTISVTTKEGTFDSSIYCRIAIAPSDDSVSGNDDIPDADDEVKQPTKVDSTKMSELEKEARIAFVSVLWSQYRISPRNYGVICNYGTEEKPTANTGGFYSEWYITDGFTKTENWGKNGWDEFTPWCACYISWAIAEVQDATKYGEDNARPSFAGVDSFLQYFYLKDKTDASGERDHWITADGWLPEAERGNGNVYPGDVIFLDWVEDDVRNPQHVGVVLYVEGDYVYTIEGNVAASYTEPGGRYGTVGLRKYRLDDPRILGYGVLDWKTE